MVTKVMRRLLNIQASEDKGLSRDRLRDSEVLAVRTRSVQRANKVKA